MHVFWSSCATFGSWGGVVERVGGIILPKPHKPDYSSPKAYRIITLLNCLGKILEKIIATRLSYLAHTTELLSHTQVGGRKQRSAIDAALLLLHHVQQQASGKRKKRVITSTLFLDIKGAFDHVSKSRLLQTLTGLGLPSNLLSWVDSFLTERKIQLAFNNRLQPVTKVEVGIPQGSPISPVLFLLYVQDIIQEEAFQLS